MSTAPPRRVVPCDVLRCCMLRAYTPTACGRSTVLGGALACMRHGCAAARHAGLSPGCTRSRGSRTTAPRRSSPTGRATTARRGCSRPARPAQRRTPQRVRPPMHRTSARARVCASVCTHMHVRTHTQANTHTRKSTRTLACAKMGTHARTLTHARARAGWGARTTGYLSLGATGFVTYATIASPSRAWITCASAAARPTPTLRSTARTDRVPAASTPPHATRFATRRRAATDTACPAAGSPRFATRRGRRCGRRCGGAGPGAPEAALTVGSILASA